MIFLEKQWSMKWLYGGLLDNMSSETDCFLRVAERDEHTNTVGICERIC